MKNDEWQGLKWYDYDYIIIARGGYKFEGKPDRLVKMKGKYVNHFNVFLLLNYMWMARGDILISQKIRYASNCLLASIQIFSCQFSFISTVIVNSSYKTRNF